jgi:PST family polysaccharide transporter
MGLAADLTLVGADVIRLLLGPNWGPAGRIFTFFAPGIGIMLVYSTQSWIHLSIGRPDRWLRWGVVELVVTGLLFLLALSWGPVGIAAAWTTSFWILTVPAFWYAGKPINLGLGPVLRSIWRYILASLLAGVACFLIMGHVQTLVIAQGAAGALAHLGISTLLFAALYAGAVIGLHGGAKPLYQMAKLLPDLVPWGRSLQSPSKEPLPACEGLQTVAPNRSIRARLHGYYQRRAASLVFKRLLVVNTNR